MYNSHNHIFECIKPGRERERGNGEQISRGVGRVGTMAAVNSRDKNRLEKRSSRRAWCTFGRHFLSSASARCAVAHVRLRWRRRRRLVAVGENFLFSSLAWQLGRRKGLLSQSTNQSAKLNARLPDLCFAICRFSQVRFITPSHLTHNLFFYFPIVFGINLIHFFDGKKNRTGQDLIICLGFSITRRAARAIWKRGNKAWGRKNFWKWKCELIANFSVTMVTSPRRERREVWREKRKVRIFGKGKCKLIANCANFWQGKV